MLLEYCCGFGMQKPKLATYWHKFHPPKLKDEQVRNIFCTHPEILHNNLDMGILMLHFM